MNYIKKIKSLGFKKIEPIVVCSYKGYDKSTDEYRQGFYIKKLSDLEKENLNKAPFLQIKYDYPIITSQYVNRIQTYRLKISEDVSLYLILVGSEFTFIVKDDSIQDEIEQRWSGRAVLVNSTKVHIKSEQLSDKFWKKCLDYLDKRIQRELLLKEIFKYG